MLNIAVIIAIIGDGASVIISMILGNSVIAILAFLLCALLGVICLMNLAYIFRQVMFTAQQAIRMTFG